jgi:hypothetical protein
MTFQELFKACEVAVGKADGPVLWNIDPATYVFWKAYSGNAKARRRYRRKHPEMFGKDEP